jgi:hypothetical protein
VPVDTFHEQVRPNNINNKEDSTFEEQRPIRIRTCKHHGPLQINDASRYRFGRLTSLEHPPHPISRDFPYPRGRSREGWTWGFHGTQPRFWTGTSQNHRRRQVTLKIIQELKTVKNNLSKERFLIYNSDGCVKNPAIHSDRNLFQPIKTR